MRILPFVLTLSVALLLSACGAPQESTSIKRENENPLVASRYGDELADAMANYIIAGDPVTKDSRTKSLLEKEINRGKDIADAARARQRQGLMGVILQMKQEAFGVVLVLDNTLYVSSDFVATPGPSVHVYLTEVVDPRDTVFPDPSAIDLGEVQSVYGAQQYALPKREHPERLRTFVLYDTTLKEIYAFAQLEKSN